MDGVGKKDRKVERNKEAREHFHIYSHSWREKEEGDGLSRRERAELCRGEKIP